MKAKYILSFSIILLIESILVLFALMAMNFTLGRGGIINYVTLRWILTGVLLLFLVALTLFVIGLFIKPGWGALGLVSVSVLAHGFSSQDRQAQATKAPDIDNVEEQVGDQNEADTGSEVENGGESTGNQEQDNQETDTNTDQAAQQINGMKKIYGYNVEIV